MVVVSTNFAQVYCYTSPSCTHPSSCHYTTLTFHRHLASMLNSSIMAAWAPHTYYGGPPHATIWIQISSFISCLVRAPMKILITQGMTLIHRKPRSCRLLYPLSFWTIRPVLFLEPRHSGSWPPWSLSTNTGQSQASSGREFEDPNSNISRGPGCNNSRLCEHPDRHCWS